MKDLVLRHPNGQPVLTGWQLVLAVRATLHLLNKRPDPALDPDRKRLLMALLEVADNDPIAQPELAAEVQAALDMEAQQYRQRQGRLDTGR